MAIANPLLDFHPVLLLQCPLIKQESKMLTILILVIVFYGMGDIAQDIADIVYPTDL